VAVVSTARYHPLLDDTQGVEREHAWPAAHCATYMDALCQDVVALPKPTKKRAKLDSSGESLAGATFSASSAMQAAVQAHASLPSLIGSKSIAALDGLWLGRVCRTATHEIGHCLGIDHCIYYACLMQGTANVCEDARQPAFLCPVDLAKLTTATGADAVERYEALLQFCDGRARVHLFAAFGAWLRVRLTDLKSLE